MAEEFFQTNVWKTVIPSDNAFPKPSCVFTLFGAKWELEMQAPILSLPRAKFRYTISLRRIGDERPRTQFSVMIFIHPTASEKDGSQFRSYGYKQTIEKDVTTLGVYKLDFSTYKEPDFTDFEMGTRVTVVCMFSVIRLTAPGIPHEAVQVMTLSDFERRLSMNCNHDVKSSLDRCEQGSSSLSSNLDSLSRDLAKLLEDKVVPDVNLSCGGRKIAAHKAILAARSQVFSAMFQSRMQESETGVVDIADVDVQVLEMFLKYVYSGKLTDVLDELLPSLYAAADKYAVSSLQTACSKRMINNLTRENCLDVLLLANAHSDQDLKNVIFNYILNEIKVMKTEDWTKFCKENLALSNEVFQFVFQRKLL